MYDYVCQCKTVYAMDDKIWLCLDPYDYALYYS